MKLLDFSILAGWPVSSTVMKFMQEQMLQLQVTSLLGGNLYIVSGCEDDGNGGVTDGVVVINGDVLPFIGGDLSAKVVITDAVGFKNFFGGGNNQFYHDRKARFGTTGVPETEFTWSSFKRNNPNNGLLARVDKLEKMLKPLIGYTADVDGVPTTVYGSWLFWGRPENEIPDGFEAVPDAEWKGRVPAVFDATQAEFNEVGKIGGAKTHTLTEAELPHLDITLPIRKSNDAHAEGVDNTAIVKTTGDLSGNLKASFGGGNPHNNLQPYRVVLFIRFIG